MIVDVIKYLFAGNAAELDEFFVKAQESGFIQFVSPSDKKQPVKSAIMHDLIAAIKILNEQPESAEQAVIETEEEAIEVARKIIELKNQILTAREENRFIEDEIDRVGPFGDFSPESLKALEKEIGRKIQFFCMKSSKTGDVHEPQDFIYINSAYDLDYFISIGKQHPHHPHGMSEVHIEKSLGELLKDKERLNIQIQQQESDLKKLAAYLQFLRKLLIEEADKYSLQSAKELADKSVENLVFFIEGWIPKDKTEDLLKLLKDFSIFAEPISMDSNEIKPTCMENEGVNRIGQDLVEIYDIPSSTDKDPSGWVFWFFVFFFAMIISDAGYGLIYLGSCLFLNYKFGRKLKGFSKRFLKLATILSAGCLVWGFCVSSFFGVGAEPGGFFGKISPLHYLVDKKADYLVEQKDSLFVDWVKKKPEIAKVKTGKEFLELATSTDKDQTVYDVFDKLSDSILLEFSLFVGTAHLCTSFLRYIKRNIPNLGWLLFTIGCYLFLPLMINAYTFVNYILGIDPALAGIVGKYLIFSGTGLAILLACFQRGFGGLLDLMNVVGIFADVLSYLRIYALGLAGGLMARAFNGLGEMAGPFFGIFVILFGHITNISLGIMGGVIHGLRLNFLEWYRYCFEGGGKLFNPLKHIKD